jgi:quercetin dioxygenase-like cupin family protein
LKRVLLFGLVVVAACSSGAEKSEAPKPAEKADDVFGPRQTLHEKPFTVHRDAIVARFLPGEEFPPGVDAVWAPIHSGTNATIFFFALRDRLQRYANPEHEETIFIMSGEGTLDLAGERHKHVEGGFVVRIPPKYSHGFTSTRSDPLIGIVVVAPAVTKLLAQPTAEDLPDPIGSIYCQDVTVPTIVKTPEPRLNADGQEVVPPFIATRPLDSARQSTLQIAAVQNKRIPDHRHRAHDETVILFFQNGIGSQRLDEVENPTQAIEVIHIPAGTVHAYQHMADGEARAICIFTPALEQPDFEEVHETRELKRPPGYKQTDEFGDFRDLGTGQGHKGERVPEVKVGPNGENR